MTHKHQKEDEKHGFQPAMQDDDRETAVFSNGKSASFLQEDDDIISL